MPRFQAPSEGRAIRKIGVSSVLRYVPRDECRFFLAQPMGASGTPRQ